MQPSFCGFLYAAAGTFKPCLTFCHPEREQSCRCIMHEGLFSQVVFRYSRVNSFSVHCCCVSVKSTAWPSARGRGTTHCARALANTHSLVHIMRNCCKSTSCFSELLIFLNAQFFLPETHHIQNVISLLPFSLLLHTQAQIPFAGVTIALY